MNRGGLWTLILNFRLEAPPPPLKIDCPVHWPRYPIRATKVSSEKWMFSSFLSVFFVSFFPGRMTIGKTGIKQQNKILRWRCCLCHHSAEYRRTLHPYLLSNCLYCHKTKTKPCVTENCIYKQNVANNKISKANCGYINWVL